MTIPAQPGLTQFVIAALLGWYLVVMGTVHIVDAFARMGECYWWLRLVQGGIELGYGAWANGDHLRSLFVVVNLAGAFAIVRGISAPNTASELRRIDEALQTVTV